MAIAPAVIAGAGAIGSSLIGGLLGSDGPSSMSPEAQYEISRLGIDINQFMAVYNLMNQQYSQQMESYGAGAYSDIYGGAETSAGEYAKSAFDGKLTSGAENMITQYGTGLGEQQNLSEDDIINQAVQSGRSVDSPDVQAQLAAAKAGVRSAFAQGKGQIMAQDYQNSVRNAMGAMASARTGRIGGGEVPGTPMDQGKADYAQAQSDWDAGRQAIIDKYKGVTGIRKLAMQGELMKYQRNNPKPQQSAFGGSYGTVPQGTGPSGSQTYGQQVASQNVGAEPQYGMGGGSQNGSYRWSVNPEWTAWKKRKDAYEKGNAVKQGYGA